MNKHLLSVAFIFFLLHIASTASAQTLRAKFGFLNDPQHCSFVTFMDSSSGNPTSWTWNFGDGTLGYNISTTHRYFSNSLFNVSLYIRRYDSSTMTLLTDTVSQQVDLRNCQDCYLLAAIDLGGDSLIPYTGIVENNSYGRIHKHHWDFGDGGTSTQATPTHSYANPGRYTITYTAFDTIYNCSDIDTIQFGIDSAGYRKRQAFTMQVVDHTNKGLLNVSNIDRTNKGTLQVYPNPAGQYFNLKGSGQMISIYDIKGTKIMNLQMSTDEVTRIATDAWARGLYMVVGANGQHLKLLLE